MLMYSEGGTLNQEAEAQMILECLCVAYPAHPWAVRVYDGGFFITHLDFPSNWGMNYNQRSGAHYSASEMKRTIIMLAGEWLERAGLKRGRYEDDQPAFKVDGVPDKDQPKEFKEAIAGVEIVGEDGMPLRSEPRRADVTEPVNAD